MWAIWSPWKPHSSQRASDTWSETLLTIGPPFPRPQLEQPGEAVQQFFPLSPADKHLTVQNFTAWQCVCASRGWFFCKMCKTSFGSMLPELHFSTCPFPPPPPLVKDKRQSAVYRCWKWVQEADVVQIKHTHTCSLQCTLLPAGLTAVASSSLQSLHLPGTTCWQAVFLHDLCTVCYQKTPVSWNEAKWRIRKREDAQKNVNFTSHLDVDGGSDDIFHPSEQHYIAQWKPRAWCQINSRQETWRFKWRVVSSKQGLSGAIGNKPAATIMSFFFFFFQEIDSSVINWSVWRHISILYIFKQQFFTSMRSEGLALSVHLSLCLKMTRQQIVIWFLLY